jgi:predicted nucleotidyltransferase component of viral defense system
MAREPYAAQVALLVRLLPFIAKEEVFALKGGTAINLFYRNMPRLSVDIDLTYLPVGERAESLADIDQTLDRIVAAANRGIPRLDACRIEGGGGATRIRARLAGAEVKIETSPVTRGVVHDSERRAVSPSVEEEFGFASMQVVSIEDLFGGKLHAAVDRQHPRDLFDVKLLYENEGFTDALFRTFLVYVASSPRPAHELLSPNLIKLDEPFAHEFLGMTTVPVTLGELAQTRDRLLADKRP